MNARFSRARRRRAADSRRALVLHQCALADVSHSSPRARFPKRPDLTLLAEPLHATKRRALTRIGQAFAATALLLPPVLIAQQPTIRQLEQITVTADRLTPTAPGEDAAREAAARVPGGTNVVGISEYEDGRASTLADVFAFAPGVFAQPRFGAEEARLSIRGSGLQRTFHMRGIYLLQDGTPITLADGGSDFQAIEPLALAYTEVMRGANALEYGATTLGGSINFVSPSGRDGGGLRPRLEVGSFGYRRALVSMGDTLSSGDYFASLSAYTQEGFRDWSEQRNERLFANAARRLRDNVETRFFIAAVHTDSQLPGSLTKAELATRREQANAGNLSGRHKRDFELYRLANRTVIELQDASLELSAGFTYKDLWHPIFQVLQQRSRDSFVGMRYVRDHTLGGHTNRFVIGLAPSWNEMDDDRFANIGGTRGARTAQSRQRSQNWTAYAQNHFDVNAQWTLVTGLQWTDAERRYIDYFLANGDQGLAASYTQLSPKLGVLWRPSAHWHAFANVSDSFEPPSFGELSGGPGVTPLRAQTARTFEIGTRGSTSRVQWDIVVYSARVRDELLALNAPDGTPLGTVNAPRTIHRGLELGAELQIAPSLTWRSAWLWNDYRFDDNPTYGSNRLPGLPRQFYRGELTWSTRNSYFVSVNTEWSPEKYAIDMANSWFADAHALLGFKVGRAPDHGLSWFLEARNLTDKTYASTTGVIADAHGVDAAQFLPGDGRAVYGGIAWRPR